jgi:hypothetical protein
MKSIESFKVPTGSSELLRKNLEKFNQRYGTDFTVELEEDLDGVEFVTIKVNSTSLDDIYMFGFFQGMDIQSKRDKNEIDW